MTLDISEAIALAKDLFKTSGDFRPHDPVLAEEFSSRAYEICNDLGIDPVEIGANPAELQDEPVEGDSESPFVETVALARQAKPVAHEVDDINETNDQLRNLLQQQAQVLQNARDAETLPPPKAERRLFGGLFSRQLDDDTGGLQSASA
ncbi:MAG: hypothetical protein AAGA21_00680 [Pseudomonadota bacterium]